MRRRWKAIILFVFSIVPPVLHTGQFAFISKYLSEYGEYGIYAEPLDERTIQEHGPEDEPTIVSKTTSDSLSISVFESVRVSDLSTSVSA
jgi:hypothetical protein